MSVESHELKRIKMLGIKGWKSYLLWEGLPFLLPISVFGFISAINWGYESKLITPNKNITDWHDAPSGPGRC